jgi:hypothetical protein
MENPNIYHQPQVAQQAVSQSVAEQPQEASIQRLDHEALNILDSVYPELRDSFIGIAIKAFKNDPMFNSFFADKSKIPQEKLKEMQVAQPTQPVQAQINNQMPQQQANTSAISNAIEEW